MALPSHLPVRASGNAILYINPHVTFYFRPEVQVTSEEGLNVYGAVTWGQFFVYQGFNEHCGWMHTSSNVDVADLYAEKIIKKDGRLLYEYNKALKPCVLKKYCYDTKKVMSSNPKPLLLISPAMAPSWRIREGQWISVRSL